MTESRPHKEDVHDPLEEKQCSTCVRGGIRRRQTAEAPKRADRGAGEQWPPKRPCSKQTRLSCFDVKTLWPLRMAPSAVGPDRFLAKAYPVTKNRRRAASFWVGGRLRLAPRHERHGCGVDARGETARRSVPASQAFPRILCREGP